MKHYVTYPSSQTSKAMWMKIWRYVVLPPTLFAPLLALVIELVIGNQSNNMFWKVVVVAAVSFLGYLLILFLMKLFYWQSKVELTQEVVSGMNFWGFRRKEKWENIETAEIIDYNDLSYLSLYSNNLAKPMYLPLFVDNIEELKIAVATLAGNNHPASLAIGTYKK